MKKAWTEGVSVDVTLVLVTVESSTGLGVPAENDAGLTKYLALHYYFSLPITVNETCF